MAHKNKDEIKAYYQTNMIQAQEVAKLFDIPKRTLYEWINKEGWEMGKHIPKVPITANELIKDEFGSRITKAKEDMQSQIKTNLMNEGISEVIAEATAQKTSDNLLISAMSVEFLDSKATETLLIAKNAYERFATRALAKSDPNMENRLIMMSKNMVDMYSQVKSTIYGKSPDVNVQIANINNSSDLDFKNLSDKELLEIISKDKKDE